jgi:hypothetical protein
MTLGQAKRLAEPGKSLSNKNCRKGTCTSATIGKILKKIWQGSDSGVEQALKDMPLRCAVRGGAG